MFQLLLFFRCRVHFECILLLLSLLNCINLIFQPVPLKQLTEGLKATKTSENNEILKLFSNVICIDTPKVNNQKLFSKYPSDLYLNISNSEGFLLMLKWCFHDVLFHVFSFLPFWFFRNFSESKIGTIICLWEIYDFVMLWRLWRAERGPFFAAFLEDKLVKAKRGDGIMFADFTMWQVSL